MTEHELAVLRALAGGASDVIAGAAFNAAAEFLAASGYVDERWRPTDAGRAALLAHPLVIPDGAADPGPMPEPNGDHRDR